MDTATTRRASFSRETTAPQGVTAWEAAYLRFETPEEEIQKFIKRLKRLGAAQWPRDSRIVELFCGRGNGLHALSRLGFRNLEAVDLSPRLISQYQGPAIRYVADCRRLPFSNRSKDAVIVQGGLHHLPLLPDDLEQTFAEIHRVLKPEGRVMFVEPWRTPFRTFALRAASGSVRLGQMELCGKAPPEPTLTASVRTSLHFALPRISWRDRFSDPCERIERRPCLATRQQLPKRAAADACCRSWACGLASLLPSAMPSPPESSVPPATLPACCRMPGSLSASGLSAVCTLSSVHPRLPNLAPPFREAAASIISPAERLASTPASSWAGATGFPLAALPLPFPL